MLLLEVLFCISLNANVSVSYLVISLTKELQPLSPFVHEDTVQVASLHWSDLNGLFSPSHDLIWADMSCRAKCYISHQSSYLCVRHMIHPFLSKYMLLGLTHTNRRGHFAPLQDDVLDDASIGVDIDPFILVAEQHLHAIWAGQEHNCMRGHVALDLFEI